MTHSTIIWPEEQTDEQKMKILLEDEDDEA